MREVLLVSGSGPKKKLDVISCLKRSVSRPPTHPPTHQLNPPSYRAHPHSLSKEERKPSSSLSPSIFLSSLRFGVAYNPYLPDMEEEQERLQEKLSSHLVSSVWLQLGSDATALRKSLDFLKQATVDRPYPLRVVGSVVIPSRKFLAMVRSTHPPTHLLMHTHTKDLTHPPTHPPTR